MFKSYLNIALRNLARHKLYTSINIFGLAMGLAVCLVIVGNISYELSFENFHKNRDRIYRVNGRFASEGEETYSARVMAPLGQAMVDEIPEVEKAAVFRVSKIRNLKIALRHIKIHKAHSFINILGLSLGITSFILLIQYVVFEHSYDEFHENVNQLYRVQNDRIYSDYRRKFSLQPIQDIYLNSRLRHESEVNANARNVNFFAWIIAVATVQIATPFLARWQGNQFTSPRLPG